MATVSDVAKQLSLYRNNPMGMFQAAINLVEINSNGETQVLSATTPFALALEMSTAIGTAIMSENESNLRKLFPSLSQEKGELYLHMSDIDYNGMFSTAAIGIFKFMISINTIRAKAVSVGPNSNVRKLTIPKHTQLSVDGVPFSLQYPIDILVLPHNGISVQYGESEVSPLFSKGDNQLSTTYVETADNVYIIISAPAIQARISSTVTSLNAAISLSKNISYTDQYLYARAYIKNEDSSTWEEIRVIHNNEVYDSRVPTVCLTVSDGVLNLYLPQIYFENDLIKDSIRLDVYTTNGPVNMVMSNYTTDAYSAKWLDLDNVSTSVYSSPIETMAVDIYSDESIVGGSYGMGYEMKRDQVINAKRPDDHKIITPDHLINAYKEEGFDLVTNIDNITERQFLATQVLPAPTNDSTITGVGSTVATLQLSITEMLQYSNVRNNGSRVTILPNMLYTKENGITRPVTDENLSNLTNGGTYTLEGLVNHVNNSNYLYSPFTYVIESTVDYFNIKPYYLNNPKIGSVYEHRVNNEVGVSLGITGYNIQHSADNSGYVLDIQIEGGSLFNKLGYENISMQISYSGENGATRLAIGGELVSVIDTVTNLPVDNKYIYRFLINTNFDINSNNELVLTPSNAGLPLDAVMDVVVVIKDYLPPNATIGPIDKVVNLQSISGYDYTSQYIGTHQFKLNLKLGHYLDNLWARGRVIVKDDQYRRYEENIFYTYDVDVPELDAAGLKIYDIVNGVLTTKIKHRAGDPILNEIGEPTIRFYKDDVMTDPITNERLIAVPLDELTREFDLILFDGLYYFATATATTDYLTEAIDTILAWSTNNIPRISKNLIDRPDIKFHPKTTMGDITVITDNGEEVVVSAYQDITVKYYLNDVKYSNAELRKYINTHTPTVINNVISNTTVSRNKIADALTLAMGNDILGVNVTGFMKDRFNIITVKDESQLPCIGKRLVINSNLTLQVEDRITIEPIRHVSD